MAGLQPPEWQDLSFPIIQDSFVQILHVNSNRWVTVAGSSSNMVHIYDSKYNFTTNETEMQAASIVSSIVPLKIQFQKGNADCGLFAVAYATDLAFGSGPASFKYEQAASFFGLHW